MFGGFWECEEVCTIGWVRMGGVGGIREGVERCGGLGEVWRAWEGCGETSELFGVVEGSVESAVIWARFLLRNPVNLWNMSLTYI